MSPKIVADGMSGVLKQLEEEELLVVLPIKTALKAATDPERRAELKAELKQKKEEFARRRRAAYIALY